MTGLTVKSAQGRDVSDFQPVQTVADWAGCNFGIAKATEGTGWTGQTFPGNWANLEAAIVAHGGGVRVGDLIVPMAGGTDFVLRGAYHFLHPGQDAKAQAAHFMQVVGDAGLRPGDLLACDSELLAGAIIASDELAIHLESRQHVQESLADIAASAAQVDAATLTFCDEVRKLAGPYHPVVVYTMHEVGQHLTETAKKYPLWFAWPSGTAPPADMIAPWKEWLFWQWGDTSGKGDFDAFNGTVADLREWAARWKRHGPFRHVAHGETLNQIAARRGTTPRHLLEVSAANYTPADLDLLFDAPLRNVAWWSTNP